MNTTAIKSLLILTLLLFLFALGCSQQGVLVTQKGDCNLKITSTEPKSPAILEAGQKLYVNIKYDMGDYNSVQIWARPRTNGSQTKGYRAHGSPVYHKFDGSCDTIQGYFFFDEPTVVDEIIVRMKDKGSGDYICVAKKEVDFKWLGYSKPDDAKADKPKTKCTSSKCQAPSKTPATITTQIKKTKAEPEQQDKTIQD
jgi:hypothetical protein